MSYPQPHWTLAHPEAIHLDQLAGDRAREAAESMRARCAALVRDEARAASSTDRTAWLMRIAAEMEALNA